MKFVVWILVFDADEICTGKAFLEPERCWQWAGAALLAGSIQCFLVIDGANMRESGLFSWSVWRAALRAVQVLLALWAGEIHAMAPSVVYRGMPAYQTPDYIKRDGGMVASGIDGHRPSPNQPPPDFSLFAHAGGTDPGGATAQTAYIFTSENIDIAFRAIETTSCSEGWLYHIAPTPNFINVNASLGQFSPFSADQEYAALGRIQWWQIISWQRMECSVCGAV